MQLPRFVAALVTGIALLACAVGCTGRSQGSAAIPDWYTTPPPQALHTARGELEQGKGEAARERLNVWLAAPENKNSPWRMEALAARGQAFYLLGRYKEATADFELVKNSYGDPRVQARVRMGLADCLFEQKEYEAALSFYVELEEQYRDVLSISYEQVLFKAGLTCLKLYRVKEADAWFNQVVELCASGKYAAEARKLHSVLGGGKTGAPVYYSLEVAAYEDKKLAEKEAEGFRALGYRDVQILSSSRAGTPVYTIHVGKFFNRSQAQKALEDLAKLGMSTSVYPSDLYKL